MQAQPSDPPYHGPLHLQNVLHACNARIEREMREAVDHDLTIIRGVVSTVAGSSLTMMLEKEAESLDPARRKRAEDRMQKIKEHREMRMSQSSSARLQSLRQEDLERAEDEKKAGQRVPPNPNERPDILQNRVFLVEVNEEEGIVRAFCRASGRMILLYDRTLYWGMRRKSDNPPETYPYRSLNGGLEFEIGMGFLYPDEPLDENDLTSVTIALRDVRSGHVFIILDEEAW